MDDCAREVLVYEKFPSIHTPVKISAAISEFLSTLQKPQGSSNSLARSGVNSGKLGRLKGATSSKRVGMTKTST